MKAKSEAVKAWWGQSKSMLALRKSCACKGTSSGPRIVITEVLERPTLEIIAAYVSMACDVCQKPWKPITDARPKKRKARG